MAEKVCFIFARIDVDQSEASPGTMDKLYNAGSEGSSLQRKQLQSMEAQQQQQQEEAQQGHKRQREEQVDQHTEGQEVTQDGNTLRHPSPELDRASTSSPKKRRLSEDEDEGEDKKDAESTSEDSDEKEAQETLMVDFPWERPAKVEDVANLLIEIANGPDPNDDLTETQCKRLKEVIDAALERLPRDMVENLADSYGNDKEYTLVMADYALEVMALAPSERKAGAHTLDAKVARLIRHLESYPSKEGWEELLDHLKRAAAPTPTEKEQQGEPQESAQACAACGAGHGYWCRGCGGRDKLDALKEHGYTEQVAQRIYKAQFGSCTRHMVPCYLCNRDGSRPPKRDIKALPNFWNATRIKNVETETRVGWKWVRWDDDMGCISHPAEDK